MNQRIRSIATAVALSLICGAAPAEPSSSLPQWPLQKTPGPDGYPHQDPATLPKSAVPPQSPRRRPAVSGPSLVDAGDGNWRLAGGWKLQPVIRVPDTALELSAPGYDSGAWLDATVPGTVLTTLVNQGVYPEPTYGLNNLAIPETLNREDTWYRNEFNVPADQAGRTFTLTFNGINYAAEVWLNGTRLGTIRGAFMRGIFDGTPFVLAGRANALVVRISPPPHPGIPHEESLAAGAGPNGGSLCLDGPTFFCTEGWDWIPGIRDRCAGIWQDVVMHVSGPVTIGDAHVRTDLPLPDTTRADVSVSMDVFNHSDGARTFTARGEIEGVAFEQPVTLGPRKGGCVSFGAGDFPALRMRNPRLWWPNGYGEPCLYDLRLALLGGDGREIDVKRVRFGVRQITYELSVLDAGGGVRRVEFSPSAAGSREVIDKRHDAIRETPAGWVPSFAQGAEGSAGIESCEDVATAPFLVIKVNGRRIACKGGNWGLDEALKRVDRGRLEPCFRLERDLGFTMIRNWCGQNTEELFYDLADEYGLMVWNDFWISTQNWNQQPLDSALWLANAEDVVKRFRNHPSIVLWCGRNEGVPPPVLNEGLDAIVRRHDSTRYYQPGSVEVNLLNSGPWSHDDPRKFFSTIGHGFTTEVGLPCPPSADAIRAMMPVPDQWPISDSWAYHDWHQKDHGEVPAFMNALQRQYGGGTGLDDFCRKAQMVNYEGYRAMFEGFNARLWQPASGRLVWMSHPAWPSTEWQLYSSDFDLNGAYFGVKKACEPLHVQLNWDDRLVVVTNTTLRPVSGLTATAALFDLQGRPLGRPQSAPVEAVSDATTAAFRLDDTPAAGLPLYFVKLTLAGADGRIVSDNFYWQTRSEEDHQLLNTLPSVALTGAVRAARTAVGIRCDVAVRNPGAAVVLLLRPVLRRSDGARVLPAFCSDGCFSLLPGEERRLTIEAFPGAGDLQVSLEGWNGSGSFPVRFD